MTPALLPFTEAFARINTLPAAVSDETVSIHADLFGRYLAADVHAVQPVPPFANSAVDGFALAAQHVQGDILHIAHQIHAGDAPSDIVAGTASAILTGAPLPANTVSVIMREETEALGDTKIRLLHTPKMGMHMRDQGEDFKENTLIARRGQRLDSCITAATAIAGITELRVFQRLRIGVFSGGNELKPPDSIDSAALSSGQIHDSNRPGLCAILRGLGQQPQDLGIVRDDTDIQAFLQHHHNAFDLMICSAGMSEGDTDSIAPAMQSLGKVLFWQLAIKPARPIGLARLNNSGCLLLGLPGNPASCLLGAWLIGRALITRLYGGVVTPPEGWNVALGFDINKKPHREEFIRATLERAQPFAIAHRAKPAGSASLSSMIKADGVLDLPLGKQEFKRGEIVQFYPFPEFM